MDHFYPEMDKEADLSSFFAPVTERVQDFFQSREKKRAVNRVEGFHKAEDKDWDGFTDNLARKSFVKQLGSDPRSDPKLLRYADSMNRLKTGKKLGTVQGKRGTYNIVKLRGSDRLGCTCNDWRYKRSVAQPGEQVDCKHIREWRSETGNRRSAEKEANIPAKPIASAIGAVRNAVTRTATSAPVARQLKNVSRTGEVSMMELGGDLGRSAGGRAYQRFGASRAQRQVTTDIIKTQNARQARRGFSPPTDPKRIQHQKKWAETLARQRLGPVSPRTGPPPPPLPGGRAPTGPRGWKGQTHGSNMAQWQRRGSNVGSLVGGAADVATKLSSAATSTAEVRTPLKEHQERVLRRLETSDGVVVAHRVGAGKTLTSIAGAVESGLPIEVVTPASLTKNYEKEINKHVKGKVSARIRSYEKALRDVKKGEDFGGGNFVVADEAHRLRNASSQSSQLLSPQIRSGKKRLLLTGTPIYNQPADIAPLVNLAAGETVLPPTPSGFSNRFIHERVVKPGLLDRMRGIEPGIVKELKNQEHLLSAMRGRVDLYDTPTDDFPAQEDERIEVPMSEKQQQVYSAVMEQAPASLRAKIRSGLPPSKAESKKLNFFTTAARQASLSPKPYIEKMTEKEELEETPKLKAAVERLKDMRKKDPNFRAVVYSNYLEAGLKPYGRRLKKEKVPFAEFTGKSSKEEKARMVRDFNAGKTPVLLVSSAGTEGLDLKGTKLVQVLEPHWNNSKIDQVIGRGVRFKSHEHLPPEERKVKVQRFYSTLQPSGFQKAFKIKPGMSAEQWIQQRADEKSHLGQQLREVMARATAKEADHVSQRIAERAPGSEFEVAKIKMSLKGRKLRPGATYHVPLERGRGWVVIGDVGGRHVVKTVLGPHMRPPGERLSMTKKARAPRDYKREYTEYHAKPEQRKNRSLRNQARRKLGLNKGDPREVDHKTPLSKGGGNGHGNLRAVSFAANRRKSTRSLP